MHVEQYQTKGIGGHQARNGFAVCRPGNMLVAFSPQQLAERAGCIATVIDGEDASAVDVGKVGHGALRKGT